MSSPQIIQQRKFDLITCSQELRKVIKGRIEELSVSMHDLCSQIGINYRFVQSWMNITDPAQNSQPMSQWDVIQLAEALGIDIRVTIVLKPKETAYANTYISKDHNDGYGK